MSEQELADREWHKIGIRLCGYFQICTCQRKLKTIIDNLYSIYTKCVDANNGIAERDFTGAEWLLIALIDKNSNDIMHGINCEYPIINQESDFWRWIIEVKDSPYLEDN